MPRLAIWMQSNKYFRRTPAYPQKKKALKQRRSPLQSRCFKTHSVDFSFDNPLKFGSRGLGAGSEKTDKCNELTGFSQPAGLLQIAIRPIEPIGCEVLLRTGHLLGG